MMKMKHKLSAGIITALTMCITLSPAYADSSASMSASVNLNSGTNMSQNTNMTQPAPTGVLAQSTAASTTAAANLRVTLDNLLGEHANLAIIAMQKGYDGAPDFNEAVDALNKNTDALSAAVGSVYGDAAAAQFKDIWNSHIGYFVDYVKATVNKDEAGKQMAIANLDKYRVQQAQFFASANPNLSESALEDGLKMHVQELLDVFNAYVNKDSATEHADLLQAYNHMFMMGDALSAAIVKQFPDKFNNTQTSTPAVDLRVALDQLLGEHANLAILAMQKGFDGASDFGTVAGALGQNTDQISAAVGSVYGKDAAAQFKTIWSSHIGYFVDDVKATANKDQAAQQTALANLEMYRDQQAKFFADANPYLNETDVANGLQMHITHLLDAFNDYVNKDYANVYAKYDTAYNHMFTTGQALSSAIEAQYPAKFGATVANLMIGDTGFSMNGMNKVFDVAPFLQEDRTFVSLRALSEAVGATVGWDGATGTVTVTAGDHVAKFWIGQDYMTLNGETRSIGTPVFIVHDRTQIPLRFIAELLGWNVDWNGNGSITLTKF